MRTICTFVDFSKGFIKGIIDFGNIILLCIQYVLSLYIKESRFITSTESITILQLSKWYNLLTY